MPRRGDQVSPVTGKAVPSYYLHSSDAYFRDVHGRAILLRGVNLSGSSKAPVGQSTFDHPTTFWSSAENGGASFVGKPLDLKDGSADVHLARLRAWGFNCLRYVFTWEALEHEGPGKYDFEFMDYTVEVLRKIKSYGFRVFMDPHQDLFSRFTGGSGAPYWVLPACGIDHRSISATQAAFLQCEWPSPEAPDPQSFPAMIWATNYTRLAAATLSCFFFAGRDLASQCVIDDVNIQDWLQTHFINACTELAKRIRDAGDLEDECVIGWDSLNEPNASYIGVENVEHLPDKWPFKKGPMPTPLQSMKLGMGQKQTVQSWTFGPLGPKRAKDEEIDPKGTCLWLTKKEDALRGGSRWGWRRSDQWPLGTCPWAAHGVWNTETNEVTQTDFFKYLRGSSNPPGEPELVDFTEHYWLPFWRSYASALRGIHKEAILFIQPPVFEPPPKGLTEDDLKSRICTSQHFYDGLTLITKHWNWFNADAVGLLRGKYAGVLLAIKIGLRAIRQGMRDQLGYLREDTLTVLGKYPTLIGEIGIPYDMDDRKTYYGDSRGNGIGDYTQQTTALEASLNACDGRNMLSFTAWNYAPTNSHKYGDEWNGEDFSFWSRDDVKFAAAGAISTAAEQQKAVLDGDTILSSPIRSEPEQSLQSEASRSNTLLPGVAHEASKAHVPAITNGSRCSQAFCRPFPVASIGTPVELNFDMKTSEMTFVVDIGQDDISAMESGLATEIFVPFLHYASDSVAGAAGGNVSDTGRYSPYRQGSKSSSQSLRSKDLGKDEHSFDALSTLEGSQPLSRAHSGMAPYPSLTSEAASSSLSVNSHTTSSASKDKLTSSSRRQLKGSQTSPSATGEVQEGDRRFTLALEVHTSTGRWEIEPGSQILRWYLNTDGATTAGRHKITMKRAGGPIAFKQSASAFELLVEQGLSWL